MTKLTTFDPGRSFDMTGLSGTYQDVGGVMGSAVVGYVIYNTSDVDGQVTFDDGTTNGPFVPAGGSLAWSRLSQVGRSELGSYGLPEGAQIQVKQVTGAGTGGDLFINIERE